MEDIKEWWIKVDVVKGRETDVTNVEMNLKEINRLLGEVKTI